MSELNSADQEIMRLATEADTDAPDTSDDAKKANHQRSADADKQSDEPLELGSEEAPEATPEQVAEEKTKKRNHRDPIQRINVLTARLHDAERRAAEAEAKTGSEAPSEPSAPDPNDEKYEFGMADPNYIKDAALFEVRKEMADERKAAQAKDAQSAEQTAATQRLTEGMAKIEKTGAEKYDDFEAKITEAVEARGGEPLPPLVSVGIAVSPAGADIAYHLATDEAASEKIEKLAQTNPQQAAILFGELEGQYLDDDSDTDLNPGDQWDVLRMLGRERARRKGLSKSSVERKTSKAPEPPENRARGAGGKFEVGDDTNDFAAYEAKIMGTGKR